MLYVIRNQFHMLSKEIDPWECPLFWPIRCQSFVYKHTNRYSTQAYLQSYSATKKNKTNNRSTILLFSNNFYLKNGPMGAAVRALPKYYVTQHLWNSLEQVDRQTNGQDPVYSMQADFLTKNTEQFITIKTDGTNLNYHEPFSMI